MFICPPNCFDFPPKRTVGQIKLVWNGMFGVEEWYFAYFVLHFHADLKFWDWQFVTKIFQIAVNPKLLRTLSKNLELSHNLILTARPNPDWIKYCGEKIPHFSVFWKHNLIFFSPSDWLFLRLFIVSFGKNVSELWIKKQILSSNSISSN